MSSEIAATISARLNELQREYDELGARMGQPEIASNVGAYRDAATRYAEIEPLVKAHRRLQAVLQQLEEARAILRDEKDDDLRAMAREEALQLDAEQQRLVDEIHGLLLPKDPNDQKNVVLEIRAGTGGDEASLFAADLLRMYQRYAETVGWRFEILDLSQSEAGGIKEGIVGISGLGAFSRLKFESGVHRVQRVPETEAQGRIHTSAATVAVLPEAEEVEVEINEDKDLRIDSFSASGPGGQHVNKTQSAVRITHLPTGLVVQCQDEKSWHKNKARALKVLRARLLDKMRAEQQDKEAQTRRGMVGSGDRSEKIRTYNFPQNRVTDHRVGLTLHRLDQVMEGDLEEMLQALAAADQAERLKAANTA